MRCRVNNWQSALQATVSERMRSPFAWGRQDCCLFAADCVLAVTGRDPAQDLRGAYRSANGAAAVLAELGGLEAIADARLGPRVPVGSAQVGDVAMVRIDGRDTGAIVAGSHMLAPGESGLVTIPMSEALVVWRCEREA
jgi:hypothetical protein